MSTRPVISRLRDAVQKSLAAHGVTGEVVVACSGGPDSLALADAVLALRARLRLAPTLVYVDHGLRPESAAEGKGVCDFAARRGVPAQLLAVKVPRRNLEEAAREARYAALEGAGRSWILLGHTASDQAETVLMRLIRGAGPVGLAAIPARRGRFLRPLLELTRKDIDAYVAARGLSPVHDSSNDLLDRFRNRVRHTLLPALRQENPAIDHALARAASAMRELAEALDYAVDQLVQGDGTSFTVAQLTTLPPALAKRLLARAAMALGASLEASHLDALLALARSPRRGKKLLAVPKLVVIRDGDRLTLAPGSVRAMRPPRRHVALTQDKAEAINGGCAPESFPGANTQ